MHTIYYGMTKTRLKSYIISIALNRNIQMPNEIICFQRWYAAICDTDDFHFNKGNEIFFIWYLPDFATIFTCEKKMKKKISRRWNKYSNMPRSMCLPFFSIRFSIEISLIFHIECMFLISWARKATFLFMENAIFEKCLFNK